MIRTTLRILLIIAIAAAVSAVAFSAYAALDLVQGNLASLMHGGWLWTKLTELVPAVILPFAPICALILGAVLMMRRMGLPLYICFVASWLLAILVEMSIDFFTVPHTEGLFTYLTDALPGSALLFGFHTGAVALCHHWLIVRRPKTMPETVF